MEHLSAGIESGQQLFCTGTAHVRGNVGVSKRTFDTRTRTRINSSSRVCGNIVTTAPTIVVGGRGPAALAAVNRSLCGVGGGGDGGGGSGRGYVGSRTRLKTVIFSRAIYFDI